MGRESVSAGFVLFEELSFCDSSLSESAIFSEGSSADFECVDDFQLLWSCCFEPCFDFGFCSEATEAESCYFVDGADGDAGGDDTCVSTDGRFWRGCWRGEGAGFVMRVIVNHKTGEIARGYCVCFIGVCECVCACLCLPALFKRRAAQRQTRGQLNA